MTSAILLPFQPDQMTPAQLAAVSYLARYTGHTHTLYAYQLRCWFTWCEERSLDPVVGVNELTLSSISATSANAVSWLPRSTP